ncbi:MAG: hypothetical protein OEO83_13065 [Alphaproteobacteria bacterium]|nr:hypothetical protein [Alphaproteobacteria bacterium]
MDKEQMLSAMHEKMRGMCASMSSDEKTDMMMSMMEKMKENIDFEQMMSKMNADDGPGGMKEMMADLLQGGEGHDGKMPEMMLRAMMPHCITMMMPKVSKDKRADVASGLIAAVVEQATKDMTAEEKAAFVGKVVLSMSA